MISFLENTEHWENTEVELATRGVRTFLTIIVVLLWSLLNNEFFYLVIHSQVKHLNFYDIVLDFILMDSFEDLENPPTSIQNVINNRWLNCSFKETVSQMCQMCFEWLYVDTQDMCLHTMLTVFDNFV